MFTSSQGDINFCYVSKKDPDFEIIKNKFFKFGFIKSKSFYFIDNEIGYKDQFLGEGISGEVYTFNTNNSSKIVIKICNYYDEKELKHLIKESYLNRRYLGTGDIYIDKIKKRAYLRLKELPISLDKIFFDKNKKLLHDFKDLLMLYINILKAAHRLHVVFKICHMDIKAANITVKEDGEVFFCDLNMSRILFQEASINILVDENDYICLDPSCDITSLGYLLKWIDNSNEELRNKGFICYEGSALDKERLGGIAQKMIDYPHLIQLENVIEFFIKKYNLEEQDPVKHLSYNDYVSKIYLEEKKFKAHLNNLDDKNEIFELSKWIEHFFNQNNSDNLPKKMSLKNEQITKNRRSSLAFFANPSTKNKPSALNYNSILTPKIMGIGIGLAALSLYSLPVASFCFFGGITIWKGGVKLKEHCKARKFQRA